MDLYQMLKADHKTVNDLFKKIAETSDRAVKTRQRLFAELKAELETHSQMEEAHFYRALNRHEDLKEMVSIAKKDHREVRKMLTEIEAMRPSDPAFLDQVKQLQKRVRLHVREEEKGIFPAAKGVLDKEQAQKLAERMERTKAGRQTAAAAE